MAAWSLAGKRFVITGASTGIGRGVAEALASRGAHVALAARGAEALEDAAAACRAKGVTAVAIPTDVAVEAQCEALIAGAVDALGGLDGLINNAGMTMWARFEDITDLSLFERLIQVNYLGSVYCTHYALPHLRQSGGLLVAVSSLTGKTGVPTRSGYAASKHAMQGFFDTLRIELAGSGVDVLVVSPGFVATDVRAKADDGSGRSHGASPRDETKGTMPLDVCVSKIVRAVEGRKREVVMTAKAKVGLWLKLIAPGLVDRIAAKAVTERK